MAAVTYDTFFDGKVRVTQPQGGYRYSVDAIILAAQPHPKPGDKLLDLGTGCGIIPLILACRNPELSITGVEVQAELAWLAQKNVADNGLGNQVRIIHRDVRRLDPAMVNGPVDWVVSNPPYRTADSGRINPNSQRALARHEINLNLHQLLRTTKRLLRTGGRFATIYPAERMVDLFTEMRVQGIEPKDLKCVYSFSGGECRLALVEGVMGGKPGLNVRTPLVIYDSDGQYSAAVQEMMALK